LPKGDATGDKESVELEESASASYMEKDLENLDISSLVGTVPNGVKMSFGLETRLRKISEPFLSAHGGETRSTGGSEANWSIMRRDWRGNSDYSTILFEGLQSSRRVVGRLTTTTTTIMPPLLSITKTDISPCHPTQGISIRFGRSTSLGSEAERPPDCSLLLRGGESSTPITDEK
jgi:hypothetical protein